MKIKTIVHDQPDDFDALVNEALEEGYMLEYRGTLQGTTVKIGHYARLVLLDPEPEGLPEPQTLDPVDLLLQLKDFCNANECEGCRLYDFCTRHLPNNEGPADWELPGEEAPEA